MEDDRRPRSRRYTIGYAFAQKKKHSFIQPSLISHAADRGIDLVPVNLDRPLTSQGPFDCIIHKLYGEDWNSQLQDYASNHPDVPIVDSLAAIKRLQNRISMLQFVSELDIPPGNGTDTFGIPDQIVIYDEESLTNSLFDLKFPVIAKPLVADGSAKSHEMALVFRRNGLAKLKPPLVLQEFVNHGGVIFKVYVVGDYVSCVKRKSLPDVSLERLEECSSEGAVSFSQVSNLPVQDRTEEEGKDGCCKRKSDLESAEMPPLGFIEGIAREMRKAMGLHLFNFDVIRDARDGSRYLVIDINYFPGYEKMPEYETVSTDFFLDIVNKNPKVGLEGCGS